MIYCYKMIKPRSKILSKGLLSSRSNSILNCEEEKTNIEPLLRSLK